jgi:hypothetical protein
VQIKPRDVQYYKTPAGKLPAKEGLSSVKDGLTQAILYKGFGKLDSVSLVKLEA